MRIQIDQLSPRYQCRSADSRSRVPDTSEDDTHVEVFDELNECECTAEV